MTDKTHPDDMAKLICDLARDHGYGVSEICLVGLLAIGDGLPEHRYGFAFVEIDEVDGTVRGVQA